MNEKIDNFLQSSPKNSPDKFPAGVERPSPSRPPEVSSSAFPEPKLFVPGGSSVISPPAIMPRPSAFSVFPGLKEWSQSPSPFEIPDPVRARREKIEKMTIPTPDETTLSKMFKSLLPGVFKKVKRFFTGDNSRKLTPAQLLVLDMVTFGINPNTIAASLYHRKIVDDPKLLGNVLTVIEAMVATVPGQQDLSFTTDQFMDAIREELKFLEKAKTLPRPPSPL